ncbi:hypothetical protein LPW26_13895 [Rhodopseudomonas sp. HC1]|uniref:hypothetical protein n=1 Tax=Rhodopseudomonas infernalis TaxID=2897386 RepID=UPI001EE8D193|nr:hypothetical protein [Rhodopseudomonas infernalis]MCG6205740.1 hypothetical protein [Rhodopseudomonas infernalis]
MTQARWRRSVAATALATCGIVALGVNVAAASPAIAAPAAGEPVETAMAFMVYGSMAVGVVAGLISRAQR